MKKHSTGGTAKYNSDKKICKLPNIHLFYSLQDQVRVFNVHVQNKLL